MNKPFLWGEFDSLAEFGLFEIQGLFRDEELPEFFASHFDAESYARDLIDKNIFQADRREDGKILIYLIED